MSVYLSMARDTNSTKVIRRAFNAGLMSKKAKWRNDVEKHAYSCEELENFYVDVLGGIQRRNGTHLLNTINNVAIDEKTGKPILKLLPFEFNRDFSRLMVLYKTNKTLDDNPNQQTKKFSLTAPFTLVCKRQDTTEEFLFFKKGNLSVYQTSNGISINNSYNISTTYDWYFIICTSNLNQIIVYGKDKDEKDYHQIGLSNFAYKDNDGGIAEFNSSNKDEKTIALFPLNIEEEDSKENEDGEKIGILKFSDFMENFPDESLTEIKPTGVTSDLGKDGSSINENLSLYLTDFDNGLKIAKKKYKETFKERSWNLGNQQITLYNYYQNYKDVLSVYNNEYNSADSTRKKELNAYLKKYKDSLKIWYAYCWGTKNSTITTKLSGWNDFVSKYNTANSTSLTSDQVFDEVVADLDDRYVETVDLKDLVPSNLLNDNELYEKCKLICVNIPTAINSTLFLGGQEQGELRELKQLAINVFDARSDLTKFDTDYPNEYEWILNHEAMSDGDTSNYYSDRAGLVDFVAQQESLFKSAYAYCWQYPASLGWKGDIYDESFSLDGWDEFIFDSGQKDEDAFFERILKNVDSYTFSPKKYKETFEMPFTVPANVILYNSITSYGVESIELIKSGTTNKLPIIEQGDITTEESYDKLRIVIERSDDESINISGTISYGYPDLMRDYVINSGWFGNNILCDIYTLEGDKQTYLSIRTPIEDLENVSIKQIGGVIYFATGNAPVQKLSLSVENGKLKHEWNSAVRIEPSQDDEIKNVVFKSSTVNQIFKVGAIFNIYNGKRSTIINDPFDKTSVGTQIKVEYTEKTKHNFRFSTGKRNAKSVIPVKPEKLKTFVTPSFVSGGRVTVTPQSGVWDGVLLLEESTDFGVTWIEIGRSTSIQGGSNTAFTRETFSPDSIVRCRMLEQNTVVVDDSSTINAGNEGCLFSIETQTPNVFWGEIISVNGEGEEQVIGIKALTPAKLPFENAKIYKSVWNKEFGYPKCVSTHEERLVLAGTINQPSTVWLSETNKWDNFRSRSILETDPLAYTLATDDGEPIVWAVSRRDLMLGTGNSEWSLGSGDDSKSLSASVVKASMQLADGCEPTTPTLCDDMVFYVRRGGKIVSSVVYDFASNNYSATELTTMCPELFKQGCKEIFNQLSPNNKVWAIDESGEVYVFTYDKPNNVASWSKMSFGDGVISGCTVSTGKYKSVFFIVKRNGFYCLEKLDCNEANNNNWLDCVPSNPQADIPEGLKTSVRYTSTVKTTPIFVEGGIKISNLQFYALDSVGGKFRVTGYNSDSDLVEDEWKDFHFLESDIFDDNREAKDIRYRDYVNTGIMEEASVEISTDYPNKFNLCAIGIRANKY